MSAKKTDDTDQEKYGWTIIPFTDEDDARDTARWYLPGCEPKPLTPEEQAARAQEKLDRALPRERPEIDSPLRRASVENPRNQPCPDCDEPNRLTPADVRLGYCCDACAYCNDHDFPNAKELAGYAAMGDDDV